MWKSLVYPMVLISSCLGAGEWSAAEKEFVRNSIHSNFYPDEKIQVIEVNNSGELSKLAAIRFFEWAKANPEGVIALPAGKIQFSEYLKFYKSQWNDESVQKELQQYNLAGPIPDTTRLKFVQINEFYAIDPKHPNSYTNFVKQNYLQTLGIKKESALLFDIKGILADRGAETIFPDGNVDLSLLSRAPASEQEKFQKTALEEAQNFCRAYEAKIREWGGIGFFLSPIGVDGLIGFNLPKTSFQSKTHLAKLDYTTAAEAAPSLGGIENTRDRVVITVGIDTIITKKDAVIIILAAGEDKADIVKRAVEGSRNEMIPVTAVQGKDTARFYVTEGAAGQLTDRKLEDTENLTVTDELIDDVIIEIALEKKKAIRNLTAGDIKRHLRGGAIVRRSGKSPFALKDETLKRLKDRLEMSAAMPDGKRILHTGPHHDDIMLSYYGLLPKILRNNSNLFIYLTSGFNSVPDSYMKRILRASTNPELDSFEAMESPYALLLARMLRAAQQQDQAALDRYEGMLLLRHIGILWNLKTLEQTQQKAKWLLSDYFATKKPGQKDMKEVQVLKGAMRESEEDRHLTVHGVPIRDVMHMRASFYTSDFLKPQPSVDKDAKPILDLCRSFKPDIITVAFDPEGTGPDTHYKVLQVIAQALRMDSKLNPKVWGYRNIWHNFAIKEAKMIIPVGEKELNQMNDVFMMCYTTQKNASFPMIKYDGPFSEAAILLQKGQLAKMKLLLGDDYFANHENEAIRNAAGLLFIKEMTKDEFIQNAQELAAQ